MSLYRGWETCTMRCIAEKSEQDMINVQVGYLDVAISDRPPPKIAAFVFSLL